MKWNKRAGLSRRWFGAIETTNVNPIGRISPKCAGMYSDDKQAVLKRVHDFCRTCGVAKLGVQLAHAGRKGPTRPPAAGDKPILSEEEGSATPEAPSARTTDYPGFNRWRGRARPDPSIGRHDCFERFLRQPLWLLPDQTTGHNLPAAFAYKILLSHSSHVPREH